MRAQILTVLMLSGCGGGASYRCSSTLFGQGVESDAPIDCTLFAKESEIARVAVTTYANNVPDSIYRARMKHVHITISMREHWDCVGQTTTGFTLINKITVNNDRGSLAHETLHAYDLIGDMENVGSILAFPVEGTQEMTHTGWDDNGYNKAQEEYILMKNFEEKY